MPSAPHLGRYSRAVWTGREAIFLPDSSPNGANPVAYEPSSATWRTLPEAPLDNVRALVWTGAELVAWGGAAVDPDAAGAAYDAASNSWRSLPAAPVPLNQVTGAWTGDEVVVFGSWLDARKRASSSVAQGVAYSPVTDSWRRLPPSKLSPQASSIAFAGDEVVAWDYEVSSQTYVPRLDEWSRPAPMPLDFSECYPSSEVVGDLVFAFFCGQVAVFDTTTDFWRELHGGPLETTVGGARRLALWQLASMTSSGEAIYLLMEGITINKNRVPCYGCPGSPRSMWVYRPAA